MLHVRRLNIFTAGRFNQEYRAAQFRGLPLPILWVAEYFTLDGEGIRWGRHYRQAGYYTHVMLWLAFPLWIMTNVLFFVLLRYGAYFMVLTGLSMVSSNILWATHRNELDLRIPFTEDDVLDFSYGTAFWICLIMGFVCIILGSIVFIMDKCMPKHIALFFGVDVLQDSEKIQVEDATEKTVVNDRETYSNIAFDKGVESAPVSPADEEEALYESSVMTPSTSHYANPKSSIRNNILKPLKINIDGEAKRSFKTAEHRLTKRLQRPRRKELPSEYASVTTPMTANSIHLDTFHAASSPGDESKNHGSLTRL